MNNDYFLQKNSDTPENVLIVLIGTVPISTLKQSNPRNFFEIVVNRDIRLLYFFSSFKNASPFNVNKYFWRGWRGLSG